MYATAKFIKNAVSFDFLKYEIRHKVYLKYKIWNAIDKCVRDKKCKMLFNIFGIQFI